MLMAIRAEMVTLHVKKARPNTSTSKKARSGPTKVWLVMKAATALIGKPLLFNAFKRGR